MAEMATTLVELDYKENLGWRIGAVVITLMAIGTIFVFSAGVEVAKGVNLSQFYESANLRKALFFPLAVAVMLVVSRIDYRRLGFDNGL
jgi:cell division protein FtsW (lipid II flippase)